ncbi:Hypothetical predicted protein [Mytilus galloprovincialis]|uniref:CCHC-type domain-containing protein n=1 Tax=Mytilus galloprovincialis TaxID=29158 RepID=A0A8B6GHK5_MYTGA|nr:Hypothetical predicted protein [Mytilus galloprovincialis]
MHPGKDVANGTRYVVVRFSPERQSLPYTLKLSTGVSSFEYIRVVHDEQKRICTQCFVETSHVYANCPDNICYKCKRFGHLARACQTPPCETCYKVSSYCRCEPVWNRGRNENEDPENDMNANNSGNETNADIPEQETNTEHQENDGMNENEAEDEHTDGTNGDDDNMEQSDDDDDNTAKVTVMVIPWREVKLTTMPKMNNLMKTLKKTMM